MIGKRKGVRMAGWLAVALSGWAISEGGMFEVTGDRVNLRARPRRDAEVVGQVHRGKIVEGRGATGEWVAIRLPDSASLWLASEYLTNAVVVGDRVYVRAGPSLAYPPLGVVQRGESVQVKRSCGEWTEIAPLSNATVWIHRDYIRPCPSAIVPATALSECLSAVGPEAHEAERPAVPALSARFIDNTVQQDETLFQSVSPSEAERAETVVAEAPESFEGVLKRTGWLDIRRLSDYALVDRIRGRPIVLCYVHGDRGQMEQLVGRRMVVKGPVFREKPGQKALVLAREIIVRP